MFRHISVSGRSTRPLPVCTGTWRAKDRWVHGPYSEVSFLSFPDKSGQMSLLAQPIVNRILAVIGKLCRLIYVKRWTYIDVKHVSGSQTSKHGYLKFTCPISVMFPSNNDVHV